MRAHELALDWFEEDFDDSDDDGQRVVDSDSDSDNEINDTNNLDDLTRSRIEAQKIKSSIVVDQVLVSESKTRQRENLDMSREDYNTLKLKTLNAKTSHRELNIGNEYESKKNEKDRLKTVKKVNIGVTIKEGDNKKLYPARKASESIAAPQKNVRDDTNVSSSSVSVAFIPFTYTTPTINNLIKPKVHTYYHDKIININSMVTIIKIIGKNHI